MAARPGQTAHVLLNESVIELHFAFRKEPARLVTYRRSNFAPIGAFAKGWKRNQG